MGNGLFSSHKGKKHTLSFSHMGKKEDKSQIESNSAGEQVKQVARLEAKGARILKIKRKIIEDNPRGTLLTSVTIYYEAPLPLDPINELTDDMISFGVPKKQVDNMMSANIAIEKLIPTIVNEINPFLRTLNEFISKCVEVAPQGCAPQDDVYRAYQIFCGKGSNYTFSKKEFNKHLKEVLSITESQQKSGWKNKKSWQGIKLL